MSTKGLRDFCEELASAEPAPGGGTAAAAAGAMAASLLSMVCGITLKNVKHETNWPKLELLKRRADQSTQLLLRSADLDEVAYRLVVKTARTKRGTPDSEKAERAYQEAVRMAITTPMSTAEQCVGVLKLSHEVASVGTRSASSDVEVARLLAAAGADGALANVMINLPSCSDASFSSAMTEKVEALRTEKCRLSEA